MLDLLDILSGTEIDTSEEELLEELYVCWLFKATGDDNGVNSDEDSNGNEDGNGNKDGNGDNGGNSEELSSVCFPDLVFTSFKAAELITASAKCLVMELDGHWSEVIILFISDGSINVACNADAIDIPPRRECFVDIRNHSLIRLSVRDKPQPAYSTKVVNVRD